MRRTSAAALIAVGLAALAGCDRGIAPQGKPGEFLITTLADPPGRKVERSLGFYCRWFSYSPGADYAAGFTGANVALKAEAEKAGANAFIHWSATSVPTSEPKGGTSTLVMICGDFAVVK
jgi:hypothetical protein